MLHPNNKQLTKLFQYAGAARFAYNWALAREMESLSNGNGFISDGDLRKEFTQLKKLSEFQWLDSISNNVTKQAIKDLCNAYKRFFDLKKKLGYKPFSAKFLEHMKRIGKSPTYYQSIGHPKFKKKKDVTRYKFYQDNVKIRFTDTHVKVEKFSESRKRNKQKLNYIKLAEKGRIPTNCKHVNPRITYDGIHWWISVGIEIEDKASGYVPDTDGVGIDLGVKDTAVCSDGSIYKNINKTKRIRQIEKKKRRLQRSISRKYEKNKKGESYCKTGNIIKAEKTLLKLEHRLTNIRQNYISQTTSEIISRKPMFIAIEDLNVNGMMKNKYLSKAVQDQKLREIRRQIEYKCEYNGIPLVIASRWFSSSRICNCCGNVKKDLKLSDRVYRCKCGYVKDRDFNASLNLKDYGMKELKLAE